MTDAQVGNAPVPTQAAAIAPSKPNIRTSSAIPTPPALPLTTPQTSTPLPSSPSRSPSRSPSLSVSAPTSAPVSVSASISTPTPVSAQPKAQLQTPASAPAPSPAQKLTQKPALPSKLENIEAEPTSASIPPAPTAARALPNRSTAKTTTVVPCSASAAVAAVAAAAAAAATAAAASAATTAAVTAVVPSVPLPAAGSSGANTMPRPSTMISSPRKTTTHLAANPSKASAIVTNSSEPLDTSTNPKASSPSTASASVAPKPISASTKLSSAVGMTSSGTKSKPVALSNSDATVSDDPVRRFLEARGGSDSKAHLTTNAEAKEISDLAWRRIPLTMQQGMDNLEATNFPKASITPSLSCLNLKSHTILRVDIQKKILAAKLVQRQLSLLCVVECRHDYDKLDPRIVKEQHRIIRSLPPTSVWRNPVTRRDASNDHIPWTNGDIPQFDEDGNIIPGMPVLPPPGSGREERTSRRTSKTRTPRREPRRLKRESRSGVAAPTPLVIRPVTTGDPNGSSSSDDVFDHSEYCRLLHVLCDGRMKRALEAVSRPVSTYSPWDDDIAPLFNDVAFAPLPVKKFPGGTKAEDISGLTPQFCRRKRSGTVLRDKFAEFKELYIAAARSYVRCKREMVSFADFSQGRAFITYAFCLLEVYSMLEPLILRNSKTDGPVSKKRRVTSDGDDDETVSKGTARRATETGAAASSTVGQRVSMDIGDTGLSNNHANASGDHTRLNRLQTSVVESDKATLETEEARVRTVTAILVAMREARAFCKDAKTDEEKTICDNLMHQLKTQLKQLVKPYPR